MNMLILFVSVFGYQFTFANVQLLALNPDSIEQLASPLSNDSVYGNLENLYKTGTSASEQTTSGWWTGRCYYSGSRSVARNSLLVGEKRRDSNNDGPINPPKDKFKLISVFAEYEAPDAFDNISEGFRREISSFIDSTFPSIGEARHTENSFASDNLNAKVQYRIRISGNYLVNKVVITENQDSFKAGDTFGYCYYFKKVQ